MRNTQQGQLLADGGCFSCLNMFKLFWHRPLKTTSFWNPRRSPSKELQCAEIYGHVYWEPWCDCVDAATGQANNITTAQTRGGQADGSCLDLGWGQVFGKEAAGNFRIYLFMRKASYQDCRQKPSNPSNKK